MLTGDFISKLKKLNSHLRVIPGGENLPLGLYLVFFGEPIHICGIDRNEMPPNTITDKQGHIIKSGWIRPLRILVRKKLIDPHKASKMFKIGLDSLYQLGRHIDVEKDPTYRAMEDIVARRMARGGIAKDGGVIFTKEDVLNFRDARLAEMRK